MTSDTSNSVKTQYEQLPYPMRDPEDEKTRLIETPGDNLLAISHYGYQGQLTISDDFNVLVAGGGTGDAVIYLAEQLKESNAKVVYIDLSSASREIAEQRAVIRGLDNITFLTGSLTDLDQFDLPLFDFINCCGVLHHLPNPPDGLHVLTQHLKDDGLMYIMLYSRHGREVIYRMQNLLKRVLNANDSVDGKICLTRQLIETITEQSYLTRLVDYFAADLDRIDSGDSSLYDLLLHSIDRAYTIDELYQFFAKEQLSLVSLVGFRRKFYDVAAFTDIPFDCLSRQSQHDFADRIYENHTKHECYVAKTPRSVASIDNEQLAICLVGVLHHYGSQLADQIEFAKISEIQYQWSGHKGSLQFLGTPIKKALLPYFDGSVAIKTIIEHVAVQCPKATEADIRKELQELYDLFYEMEWCYLCTPQNHP